MKTTKKLITLVMLAWLMPLDAFAANITGDVNNDSEVNIADVNAVIDIILSGETDLSGDVNGDGEVNIADVNAIIDIILGGGHSTPVGHEWVDLGLPSGTLWATCNVGANAPEEYGDYFAWGETEPKQVYTWGTYKWTDDIGLMMKYCLNSYYGQVDDKYELELADDAAYMNWGPLWRMPSAEQIQELCEKCTWTVATNNGVDGYMITGPNEATIFIPAMGMRWQDSLDDEGHAGYCWSRTLYSDESNRASRLGFQIPGWYGCNSAKRFNGHAVRAVYVSSVEGQNLYIEQHSLDLGDVPIEETCTGELIAVNNTSKAVTLTVTADEPFLLNQEEGSVSSITVVIPGYSFAPVTVMFTATAPGEYDGNVVFQSSALEGGQSIIPVHVHAFNGDDHEWVDLGLPSGTLWATCNIGATSPEGYGDHFAWGETVPKDSYEWSNYKWGDYSVQGGFSKYVTSTEYGTIDYKTELEPEDDAASVNWGQAWRMPSREQLAELASECSWEWTSINGVDGLMATGPNGNTLFMPLYSIWTSVEYWSRSLRIDYAIEGHTLNLYGGDYADVDMFESTREKGFSIRAVRVSSDDLYIEQQSLDLGVVPVGETCTGELTIVNCTMDSMTLTFTADAPFTFNQEEGSASSMTIVVPGNTRDTVAVMFTATTPGEFNGNVTIQNTGFDGGQRVIPIHARAFTDDFPQHEYVDMGLPSRTLWATCNIGANSPEEYGDYFAWGEIEPKEAYTWETYKWCSGTSTSMTKYCLDSYYGLVDHKYKLEPADDAAYMNWGPSWRIPTREQLFELDKYCTWQSATINGIDGHLVTGPNGNTLFFPKTGYYDGSTLQLAGYYSFYWSGTLNAITYCNACCTYSMNFLGNYSRNRYNGLPVRAVRLPQD